MTEQDRYTELYETWCRVDLINLIIKLEESSASTWKPHWKNYHDPRPVNHRGMIAWSITKPLELQKPNNKDMRLSSGTSDKRVAEKVKWEKAAIIYQRFDEELERRQHND